MKVNKQIMYHEGGRGAILKLKISVVEELISCFCPEGVKLAGKTLLLDQSTSFGGAQIFSLHQAAAEPTETSVGLLLRKVKLNFTRNIYHPLCFMS